MLQVNSLNCKAGSVLVMADDSISLNLMPCNCEKHLGASSDRNEYVFPQWLLQNIRRNITLKLGAISGFHNCLYSYFTIVADDVYNISFLNRSNRPHCVIVTCAVPSSTDQLRQLSIASERPFEKVSQLNNQQITQALNDYGVLNEVIES